jgi:hypothetical protein
VQCKRLLARWFLHCYLEVTLHSVYRSIRGLAFVGLGSRSSTSPRCPCIHSFSNLLKTGQRRYSWILVAAVWINSYLGVHLDDLTMLLLLCSGQRREKDRP